MYTIKQVAEKSGVSEHTIRFYAKEGLFPFLKRDKNNVRLFSEEDLEEVATVVVPAGYRNALTGNQTLYGFVQAGPCHHIAAAGDYSKAKGCHAGAACGISKEDGTFRM